jgi:aspartyl-tRNA(Asn)/glutamyl-tRNA(Gln) amidotransferase subunit A
MTKTTSIPGAYEMLELYRGGKLSPVEVVRDCLKQILKYNPVLNAVCFLDESSVLHQARSAERRWKTGAPKGALDGVPVTLKDWVDAKGWPTRYGSKTSSDIRQPADSPAVARLREEGAILFAKTTLPDFAHKGVTDSPLTGVTRNPWNPAKTPGGSSGGAAVAAVTGMAPLNLGSDAGGSIRIPASFSGVVGFKPSPGLVPSWPPSIFASLSALGPLTRSVRDAALMLDVLTKPDAHDWNALPLPPPRFVEALKKPLPKLRIAWAPSINGVTAARDAREVFDANLKVLSSLGSVDEIELKSPTLVETFLAHWIAIASSHVSRMKASERKQLDPHYLEWARQGDALGLRDYLDAEKERMHIGGYFKGILDAYDILATPTTPMTAFDVGIDMPHDAKGRPITGIWTPFTLPANLAKLPAVSLPLGLTKDGMPVGIQLMSGYLKDTLLMQAAQRLEAEIGFQGWLARNEKV